MNKTISGTVQCSTNGKRCGVTDSKNNQNLTFPTHPECSATMVVGLISSSRSVPMGCDHVKQLLTSSALANVAHAAETVFSSTMHRPVMSRKARVVCRCMVPSCPRPTYSIHVCVQCVFFGCMGVPEHLNAHFKEKKHSLYLSVEHARLYCLICKDFVFHPIIDAAIEVQKRIALNARRNFFTTNSPLDESPMKTSSPNGAFQRNRSKRRRLKAPVHWVPTKQESQLLGANSYRLSTRAVMDASSPVGLYNLGNSCYMNSVLHAIVHAPPLRNFFLADLHRPFCNFSPSSDCFACALDGLITASYSNPRRSISTSANNSSSGSGSKKDSSTSSTTTTPFIVPQKILEIIWKNADHLATYAQHDAHEFLIAALNILNTHSKRAIPSAKWSAPLDNSLPICPKSPVDNLRAGKDGIFDGDVSSSVAVQRTMSIVKSIFSGTLQSDVVCSVCGNSSPTLEKFYDVSLDVDKLAKSKSQSNSNSEGGSGKKLSLGQVNTLTECLSRFTEPEALGPGCKLFCNMCGRKEEALKQMSIRSMPAIISFHFKRFEQSFVKVRRSEMKKVDTPVEFPVDGLDLSSFQTSTVLRRREKVRNKGKGSGGKKNEAKLEQGKWSSLRPLNDALYDLFAVVNHNGTIDSGHYTAWVRREGDWFKCDDDKVSKMKVKSPISSTEAYLLFYAQRQPNLQL